MENLENLYLKHWKTKIVMFACDFINSNWVFHGLMTNWQFGGYFLLRIKIKLKK